MTKHRRKRKEYTRRHVQKLLADAAIFFGNLAFFVHYKEKMCIMALILVSEK